MDEFGLEKTNKKLSENEVLIKVLTKLLNKKGAPSKEIAIVIDGLNERQITLNTYYKNIVDNICEEADLLAKVYAIEEGGAEDDEDGSGTL